MTNVQPQDAIPPITWRRLPLPGLLAAGAAALSNLIVFSLATSALDIPLAVPLSANGPAEPITAVMVIVASILPAIGATVLLGVLARFVRHPVRVFQLIALGGLVLSLVGPALQPIALPTLLVLLSMHAVAALAIVGVLSRFGAGARSAS